MQEILAQQRNAAKPVTGKAFFLGVIGIVIRLALAQAAVNFAIMFTGLGLLNIAFYLYAIWAIIAFMRRTVAGSLYMLKENTLYLQKTLGDSTTSVVEIPLDQVLAVREVMHGERLESSYHRVTVIDAAAAKTARMRLSFGMSLISASLARRIAGPAAMQPRASVVAYMDEGRRCACVFLPDERFMQALGACLPHVCGKDERTGENTKTTMLAQALKRAFPELYAHVAPLVSEERVRAAEEEIAAQKKAREEKKNRNAGEKTHRQEETGEADEVQDDTL